MNAVHGLKRDQGLDLLLHTPGGSVAATFSIISYLRKMFGDDIRAIVPQIAMSGGTVIACSCRQIIMAKHSQLGPIDPQFGGMPAAGVLLEFERARKEIKKDPSCAPLWQAIVGQYSPSFLGQCHNALLWSQEFATEQLTQVMFKGERRAASKARAIVAKLTDYKETKRHERPIHIDECNSYGLKVESLESQPDPVQDLVLSVHHCYMHAFMNGPAFKIIENQCGGSMVKNVASQAS